jgi:superfamily II DNA or RNA helicase
MNGYIYIIDFTLKDLNDAIKIGSTKYPKSRINTYQTGLYWNINYKKLYKIIKSTIDCYEIDDLIQNTFSIFNWKKNHNEGGDEWYISNKMNSKILEDFFDNNNIEYQEVKLEDCPNEKSNEYINELISKSQKINNGFIPLMKPFNYQQNVLDNLTEFKKIKKGKLLWACGLGKTYMSLFICSKLNVKNILICVPSLYLLNQYKESIKNMFKYEPLTLHCNGDNIETILESLINNDKNIVISTYHSIYKLLNITFDIKIADEAHHTVSIEKPENENTFEKFHLIPSKYSLFMTATEKNNIYNEGYNMNDENVFGIIIDKKSVKWAIENKKITDYKVICLQNSSLELNNICDKIILNTKINKNINEFKITNKNDLFFASYSALKMISEGESKHMLIYTNNCDSANLVELMINNLLENNIFEKLNKNDIYNKSLNSKMNINLNEEVNKFKNHKYGIIPCVYIFGEGVDIPKLDSVIIAEKMTTEIRIVQSCLRPNRIDKNQPDKIAKIIIPLNISTIDEKLKMVISKLANEDEIIEQKVEIFTLIDKNKKSNNSNYIKKIKLKPNKDLLEKIIYDLYNSGSFGRELSIQKEYQLYRDLVLTKQFKTIKEYKDSNMRHKEPHIYFNKVWIDWFDFLNIDKIWINDLVEWKEYCKEKNITNSTKYFEYLNEKLDDKLPPEPEYLYPNFKGIDNELYVNKLEYMFL